MKNQNLQSDPNLLDLKKLHSEGGRNLGLFIGAGLSKSAGLKGWEEMLSGFLKNPKCKEQISPDRILEIQDMIKLKQYTHAAYLIKAYVGSQIFQECLEQDFDRSNNLSSHVEKALENFCYSADINLIVTTNFDKVLENSLSRPSEKRTDWSPFTHKQSDRIRSEISKGSRVIFKIHGDIKDADSIVLTQDKYQELYYSRNDFTFLLATLLDTYTFLFIGFSLVDPFFSTVLDMLSAYYGALKQKHFALISDLSIAQKRALEDLRGVKVISYDSKGLEDHEAAVISVLKEIGNIPSKDRVIDLSFNWTDLGNWINHGGNPKITEEDGEKVLKVHFTEKEPGTPSNCSVIHRLPNIRAGCTVQVRVKFKCDFGKYGMIFIGDAAGPHPYDNSRYEKKQGNGDWQEIITEIKYTHDDQCSIFLYGNRNDGRVNDFVLYKDLKLSMIEPG